MSEFLDGLKAVAADVEKLLDRLITGAGSSSEGPWPQRLTGAMRHAVLGGGKRLRPYLLIETAGIFGLTGDGPLRAGTALELVHCYSLVHDDLPAMDNDDVRRGRPTVHKAFDEASAILAGDALLTLAFGVLAEVDTDPDPRLRTLLIQKLVAAAGPGGMAGGQMLDLSAEKKPLDEAGIIHMQAMKTGALFRYACEAGAMLGRASNEKRERLAKFGSAMGLAFQLADDLIDATGTAATAGKATAKDEARGKSTLVRIHGVEKARALLGETVEEAVALLTPFGKHANGLAEAVRFAGSRRA